MAQGSARGRRVRRIGALLAVVFLGVLPRSARGGQFHPNKSTSFINEEQLFKVEYLDDASLTGFVAEDIVQLGDYYVSTRFGCVTKSKGHDWAQADGILGMGFPAAALRTMSVSHFYPVGTPGKPWDDEQKAEWLKRANVVQRSYAEEVLA